MNNQSVWSSVFTVVGFIVIGGLLLNILGGILGFALHILLPMALVVWLVRFIFGGSRRNRHYY